MIKIIQSLTFVPCNFILKEEILFHNKAVSTLVIVNKDTRLYKHCFTIDYNSKMLLQRYFSNRKFSLTELNIKLYKFIYK